MTESKTGKIYTTNMSMESAFNGKGQVICELRKICCFGMLSDKGMLEFPDTSHGWRRRVDSLSWVFIDFATRNGAM